jgi:predicted nucleic acid-binding protein
MKTLIDTNVVLDWLLARQPFDVEAVAILNAFRQKRFSAFVSAITPSNVFYIVRKQKGIAEAQQAVLAILTNFQICTVDYNNLQLATTLGFTDYEDAIQNACAITDNLDCIVTRDLKDYTNASLPVYSPVDFLKLIP